MKKILLFCLFLTHIPSCALEFKCPNNLEPVYAKEDMIDVSITTGDNYGYCLDAKKKSYCFGGLNSGKYLAISSNKNNIATGNTDNIQYNYVYVYANMKSVKDRIQSNIKKGDIIGYTDNIQNLEYVACHTHCWQSWE